MLAPDPQQARRADDAASVDLCRFIAACYYEPDAGFAEEGLFEIMGAAAARLDPDLHRLAQDLGRDFGAVPLDELRVDHARLFIGPGAALAQPYASVWLSGENTVMHAAVQQVLAWYDEAGFEVGEHAHESPDHVAIELEFLYLLLYRALLGNDAVERQRALHLAVTLLDDHLGRWLGPFLLAMHDKAQTAFYETLAELTEAFVRLAAQRVHAARADAAGVSPAPAEPPAAGTGSPHRARSGSAGWPG